MKSRTADLKLAEDSLYFRPIIKLRRKSRTLHMRFPPQEWFLYGPGRRLRIIRTRTAGILHLVTRGRTSWPRWVLSMFSMVGKRK